MPNRSLERPQSVAEYLASLPADRRAEIESILRVVRENIDPEFQEGIQYAMIGWSVPHSIHPEGYHCDPRLPVPFAALASRKGYISFGIMGQYVMPEEERWFRTAWERTGMRLDMGKACVRIRRIEEAPLDVIGEAFRRIPLRTFLERYQSAIGWRPAGARKPIRKSTESQEQTRQKKPAPGSSARKGSNSPAKKPAREPAKEPEKKPVKGRSKPGARAAPRKRKASSAPRGSRARTAVRAPRR